MLSRTKADLCGAVMFRTLVQYIRSSLPREAEDGVDFHFGYEVLPARADATGLDCNRLALPRQQRSVPSATQFVGDGDGYVSSGLDGQLALEIVRSVDFPTGNGRQSDNELAATAP